MEPIESIDSWETLKAWLDAYRKQKGVSEERFWEVAVQLAHRSAMRTLPVCFLHSGFYENPSHNFLRHLLVSGVVQRYPTSGLRAAVSDIKADYVGGADPTSAYHDATAAASAAYAAARAPATRTSATHAVAYTVAIVGGFAKTSHYGVPSSAIWSETKTDLQALVSGKDLFTTPLWNVPNQGAGMVAL